MKVMKFGGTSLANWSRFSMAADIIAESSVTEPVATVLSAPATITNALLEMVDLAVSQQNYQSVLDHINHVFNSLFSEASASLLSVEQYALLSGKLAAQMSVWQGKLNGITLLGECPDSVRAQIVVTGERLSAALMEQVMLAKGLTSAQLDFAYAQEYWPADQNYLNVYYRDSVNGSWNWVWADSTNQPAWTDAIPCRNLCLYTATAWKRAPISPAPKKCSR